MTRQGSWEATGESLAIPPRPQRPPWTRTREENHSERGHGNNGDKAPLKNVHLTPQKRAVNNGKLVVWLEECKDKGWRYREGGNRQMLVSVLMTLSLFVSLIVRTSARHYQSGKHRGIWTSFRDSGANTPARTKCPFIPASTTTRAVPPARPSSPWHTASSSCNGVSHPENKWKQHTGTKPRNPSTATTDTLPKQ